MAVAIKVPTLGLSITNVIIMEWKVKEGIKVEEGDPLAAVETEKVNFDVVAPIGGYVLKILEDVGSKVTVEKTPIAIIGEKNEDISEFLDNSKDREAENVSDNKDVRLSEPVAPEMVPGKAKAMPAVRRLAKKYGINLDFVKGTGQNGLITKKDVEDYYLAQQRSDAKPSGTCEEEVVPFTGVRKQIANNLLKSLQTAAHVTILDEVDMSQVISLRKELEKDIGSRISYVAFVIKAAAKALEKFPIINSVIDGDKIRIKKYININIAVASGDHLVVPVLRNIEKKDLFSIASEFEEIVKIARDSGLTPQMMIGGTLTISNPGPFGTLIATPIINQPQSAIVWMGRIVKRPVVVDDRIEVRSMMYLCMSYDHRVMDGFVAAQYIQEVKKYLQNPALIMV